jgi:hypothetical protein
MSGLTSVTAAVGSGLAGREAGAGPARVSARAGRSSNSPDGVAGVMLSQWGGIGVDALITLLFLLSID